MRPIKGKFGTLTSITGGRYYNKKQSFSITHARYLVVDFTVYIDEQSSTVLIPSPTRGIQTFAVLRPFHLEVITSICDFHTFLKIK